MGRCARNFISGREDALYEKVDDDERLYLRQKVESIYIPLQPDPPIAQPKLSSKVESLLDFLAAQALEDFTGLIFVQQRAEVAVLANILSTHSKTRDLFRVGTFVGSSTSASRGKRSVHCKLTYNFIHLSRIQIHSLSV